MREIIIFSGFYLPGFRGGGPIRTISNMVDALGDDIKFKVVTRDRDLGESKAYSTVDLSKWNQQGKAEVFYLPSGLKSVRKIFQILRGGKFSAVNLNGFFSVQFSIVPLIFCFLFLRDTCVILGPRGEFSDGALGIKNFKKKIFILFLINTGLYKNVTWLASSDYESNEIKRVAGKDANIQIAIDIARPGINLNLFPRMAGGPLRIVFISRISPKKNLIFAIEVLRKLKKHVVFDVYGPIEDQKYWAECCHLAELLPENVNFNYRGSLLPSEVVGKLSQYDLFFFPTLGENFGHVIAEAFSAGLPVLISDTTPWRDLRQKSIGWDISLDCKEKFIVCIEACCGKSSEEYENWRKSIRTWALENIGNEDAVEQNRKLFMNLK